MDNPFKPTFGVSPPSLVGRTSVIDRFSEELEAGPGSPGRATIYTGAKGVGKTVMLNEVEEAARKQGWLVISETATKGFLSRISTGQLPTLLSEQDPQSSRRLTGVSAPLSLGGLAWQNDPKYPTPVGLRSLIKILTDILTSNQTGLLITLDEIHYEQIEELREFGAGLQHAFRENTEIAFAGAGLPSAVEDVLNDKVLTFLRRAEQYHLGTVTQKEAKEGLRDPVENNGRNISPEACEKAAVSTGGYPFLIQLVGYYMWRAHPKEKEITLEDVESGIIAARERMNTVVYEPLVKSLSEKDKNFLEAMVQDDKPSLIGDIMRRLNLDKNNVNQYRRRLIASQVLKSAGYGKVSFAIPYLREYLQEHGTDDEF